MSDVMKLLIGGEQRASKMAFEVCNPFTGEKLADVCTASFDDNEVAVAEAVEASQRLRRLARFEIAAGLRKISDGIRDGREKFAMLIAAEAAKPIRAARAEVDRAVATFAWAAGEAERFTGEVVPIDTFPTGRGKTATTRFVPRGVVYGITPFNFPLNLVAHKVAPALASGNAIIIKPSPRTPLTAFMLGEIFLASGLPKGALQIVPTEVGNLRAIYDDERVGMISFTGSDAVGWQIRAAAPRKHVSLELGGSAPVIVDESADIDTALTKCVGGAFGFAGQVCISVQRIFVHETHFDDFAARLANAAAAIVDGDPLDETTEMSVMIDEAAAIRAKAAIDEAIAGGASLLTGGRRERAFLDATVLTDTHSEMRVFSDEIFAPVVAVEKFSDFGDAIELANATRFGLQAGVFTNDLRNARRAGDELIFGGVNINDVPTFRVDNQPYGGVKASGFGREGVRYAMEEMCEVRVVVDG